MTHPSVGDPLAALDGAHRLPTQPVAGLPAVAAEIRGLHRVVMAPGGVVVCDHCCLNRIGERRFSCVGGHNHRFSSAPCKTLAILERFGQ